MLCNNLLILSPFANNCYFYDRIFTSLTADNERLSMIQQMVIEYFHTGTFYKSTTLVFILLARSSQELP